MLNTAIRNFKFCETVAVPDVDRYQNNHTSIAIVADFGLGPVARVLFF